MLIIGLTIRYIILSVIDILSLLMLIRSLLSWIMPYPEGRWVGMLYNFTDVLVTPVRRLLSRFEFVRRCPIDLSFLATFMLLSLLRTVLQ